eukprot:CAMPEP_0172414500 /NCGR_PEP_ID=MMETSP1064-20121228/1148_1 /TAXON_ID=202472 /ORGANISM="Aulacoseira subarctica , Strain CCAP 1002/5" /LENGTH=324 /DNA_ID=CAMNT_0013151193 /DNA_START=165 /DNA_END=1136 /DNA_ORIENTATION=-
MSVKKTLFYANNDCCAWQTSLLGQENSPFLPFFSSPHTREEYFNTYPLPYVLPSVRDAVKSLWGLPTNDSPSDDNQLYYSDDDEEEEFERAVDDYINDSFNAITEHEQLILDQYEAQFILQDAESLAGTEFDADDYGVSDDLRQFVATCELRWQHFQERLNFDCLLPYVDYYDDSYGYTEQDFLEMLQDAEIQFADEEIAIVDMRLAELIDDCDAWEDSLSCEQKPLFVFQNAETLDPEPPVQHMAIITKNQAASASVNTTANLFELVPCTAASFHLDFYAMKHELIIGAIFVRAIKPAFIILVEFIKEFHINLFLFAQTVVLW